MSFRSLTAHMPASLTADGFRVRVIAPRLNPSQGRSRLPHREAAEAHLPHTHCFRALATELPKHSHVHPLFITSLP